MNVLGFDNVFLEVGDLEEAIGFYRDVVGLPVHRRFDAMKAALFQVGEETPGLGVGAVDEPRPNGFKVWFEVPDARAVGKELAGRGVIQTSPPFPIPTGWVVEIRDPWGNVLGFTDYANRPELGRPGTRPR